MRFGINFFPSVEPTQLSGHDYYRQALALATRADALGYHHIRTVEHYFRGYGGYSPSPIVFLTAVAQIPPGVTVTDPATVANSWGRGQP